MLTTLRLSSTSGKLLFILLIEHITSLTNRFNASSLQSYNMKFPSIPFSYALLTSYASAAPRVYNRLEDRIARRAGRSTRPIQQIQESVATGNETSGSYSTNWSGAVYSSPPAGPPSGQTWDIVTANIVVPTLSVPSGSSSSGTYSVAAWIGIDGYTYQDASLQSGVDFTISNGVVSYTAWYDWLPDNAYDVGIEISEGDTITITLSLGSSTTGIADIANNTTGKVEIIPLSSSYALAGQNAEWIVGDWMEGSTSVSPCDWGTVSFMSAFATSSDSTTMSCDDALIINMVQNNVVLSSVSISGNTVTDTYV
jgi:hypothetical protein